MIIIGLIVVAALVALSLSGFLRIQIDLAMMVFGVAAIGLLYLLFVALNYWKQPKRTVIVSTKATLKSPPNLMKSIMTYKLHLITEHQVIEKGASDNRQIDEVIIKFNLDDHPNIYEFCLQQLNERIRHGTLLAQQAYPEANVVSSEAQLPGGIKALEQHNEQ